MMWIKNGLFLHEENGLLADLFQQNISHISLVLGLHSSYHLAGFGLEIILATSLTAELATVSSVGLEMDWGVCGLRDPLMLVSNHNSLGLCLLWKAQFRAPAFLPGSAQAAHGAVLESLVHCPSPQGALGQVSAGLISVGSCHPRVTEFGTQ